MDMYCGVRPADEGDIGSRASRACVHSPRAPVEKGKRERPRNAGGEIPAGPTNGGACEAATLDLVVFQVANAHGPRVEQGHVERSDHASARERARRTRLENFTVTHAVQVRVIVWRASDRALKREPGARRLAHSHRR